MKKTTIWLLVTAITISCIIVLLFSYKQNEINDSLAENNEEDSIFFQPSRLHYKFEIDSSKIVKKGQIKWNQNLSEILLDFNVTHKTLYTLSKRAKKIYDVRKLKAGARYSIIHEKDSLKTAQKFIFEPSPSEYVVYHLTDSIYAQLHKKPIEIKEKILVAEISSSLYNTILEQDISPLLVNKLVDVFAWQVDFFRIAKGDKVKVIFDQEMVNGKVIGIKNIKGAYFEHWGKPYYAIPYQTAEKVDFFDEKGNSLRKTFLKAPLNYMRISSRYSLKRFHPVQKKYKAHLGTDYAAPTGTPIRTVGDGKVLEAKYHRGNGNYVKIKHNSNYTTQYLHMSKIARGIKPGKTVKQGQTIGYVGKTGLANGPHLCFRFWKNGRQVNALKIDLPSSSGIESKHKNQFKIVRDSIQLALDQISFLKENKFLVHSSANCEEWGNP